ncbi:MAG: DUF4350 domain-containing protein [Verrucomicrobiota bacterium]
MKRLSTVILGGLLACTLSSCGKFEEREREVGYKGPARWNPFLAAERLLTEMGLPAENRFGLGELPPHSDTLIVPSNAIPEYGFTSQIQDWVSQGGHLVYFTEGGDRFLFEFGDLIPRNEDSIDSNDTPPADEEEDQAEDQLGDDNDRSDRQSETAPAGDGENEEEQKNTGPSRKEDPILKRFNIRERRARKIPTEVLFQNEIFQVDLPSQRVFIDPSIQRNQKNQSNSRRTPIFTTTFGKGRVTVISHAHPFRNPNIGDDDNALLFWKIIQLQPGNGARFIIAGRTSLWSMIWQYGWTVVIGLALVIALWLWKSLTRFGPLQSPENNGARDFFEHIDMTGKFLWRRGNTESLLEPLRQNTMLSLHKKWHLNRTPGALLQQPDLERIADHTGLPIEVIRNALLKTKITDSAELTRTVRELQLIQSSS